MYIQEMAGLKEEDIISHFAVRVRPAVVTTDPSRILSESLIQWCDITNLP